MLLKAIDIAVRHHHGQTRKYDEEGMPYILHPIRVAKAVEEFKGVETTVCAALLHDVLEDASDPAAAAEEIKRDCGLTVLALVNELTNTSKGSTLPRAARKMMDRDRLRKASAVTKIIKMVDRIDNLQHMQSAPEKFKELYAAESLLLAAAVGDASKELKEMLISEATKLT